MTSINMEEVVLHLNLTNRKEENKENRYKNEL